MPVSLCGLVLFGLVWRGLILFGLIWGVLVLFTVQTLGGSKQLLVPCLASDGLQIGIPFHMI